MVGALPRPSRRGLSAARRIAKRAGLSKHQLVQAVRVASAPDESFERQVESDQPPTITALAKHGKRPWQWPCYVPF